MNPGRTMLVVAESPSNPRLDLVDLADLGAVTGPFTVIDSTFATPLGQQPIRYGVDLVLHSATKGISGHNDATLGVVAGERDLIASIWSYSVLHGACASPFDALNGLRGIRTLAVRQRHQAASALQIAEALRGHPGVAAVYYPGLESHPQHALATEQLTTMPTLLAVDLAGGVDSARVMLDALRLARPATSLGGPETLVCHSATSTHVSLTPEDQAAIGITDGLLRISIGLEDARRTDRRPEPGDPGLMALGQTDAFDTSSPIADSTRARISGRALLGAPASNGGCGSYSIPS